MPLNLGKGFDNIFPHSKAFDQGLGKVRKGAGTVVVALDGSGDANSITEGLKLLPSTGGVIYIKEGTYVITTKISVKSNISIIGTGYGTRLNLPNDITFICFENNDTTNGNAAITFEGMRFSSNAADVKNCIRLVKCTDCMINKCWFEQSSDTGAISIEGASIRVSVISNFLNDSVEIIGTSLRCLVSHNLFGATTGLVNLAGSGSHALVGNTFQGSNGQDIKLASNNCTCIGNVVVANTGDAAVWVTGDNCTITGNYLNGSTDAIGVQATADKTIIVGNQVVGGITNLGTNTEQGHNLI